MPQASFSSSRFKTRHRVAQEYGLSYSTFWRRIKYHGIELPPGLINLRGQRAIYEEMGYRPEWRQPITPISHVNEIP